MQMRLDKARFPFLRPNLPAFLMDPNTGTNQPEQLLGLCFVLPAAESDPEKEEVFSTTFFPCGRSGEAGVIPVCAPFFRIIQWPSSLTTACCAYAEKKYTGIREKDYAFIRFSRGIGASLFIQDKLLGQACASYTQFGHFSISLKALPVPAAAGAAWR